MAYNPKTFDVELFDEYCEDVNAAPGGQYPTLAAAVAALRGAGYTLDRDTIRPPRAATNGVSQAMVWHAGYPVEATVVLAAWRAHNPTPGIGRG